MWMHCKKQNSDFQFLTFPIDYVGGLRLTVGSKDQLQNFFKGHFCSGGSSGTRFDHGQFEIKTFPYIYAESEYGNNNLNFYKFFKSLKILTCCLHPISTWGGGGNDLWSK